MNPNKTMLLSSTIVIVCALAIAPIAMSNNVLATGYDYDNMAKQIIAQVQSSSQNSQVVSADDTENSGNNVNVQVQVNEGNNALAQD